MTQLTGTVEVRDAARGSKSEQQTVVLVTDERFWLLRRQCGPTYGVDPELARWAGRLVTVTGIEGSGTFLVTGPVAEAAVG
jgi:hypothetical protein